MHTKSFTAAGIVGAIILSLATPAYAQTSFFSGLTSIFSGGTGSSFFTSIIKYMACLPPSTGGGGPVYTTRVANGNAGMIGGGRIAYTGGDPNWGSRNYPSSPAFTPGRTTQQITVQTDDSSWYNTGGGGGGSSTFWQDMLGGPVDCSGGGPGNTTTDNPLPVVNQNNSNPPATPQLSSGGACIVGSAHAISMISTDPDSDLLRYGVDWDANGSIDEWVPGAGYIASGIFQVASHVFNTGGTQVVKVLAQDSSGLNSGWASVSFVCNTSVLTSQCNDGLDNDGDGVIDNQDPDCSSSGGISEFSASSFGSNNSSGSVPDARLSFTVPPLVARNARVSVVWVADNVSVCAPVTSTNGDSFAQFSSDNLFFSPVGGALSLPITARTVFTLTCIDLRAHVQTKTATVNIQPNFQER